MQASAPGKVAGADGGGDVAQQVAQGGGHDAHSATQAGAGVQQLGQVYGAWGTDAKFAVVSSSTEQHHGDEHERVILQRTTPNDTALAKRILQASLTLFGSLGMPAGGKTHVPLTAAQKSQWSSQNPGLPVPNQVVFDAKSGRAVGMLFVGGDKAKDLGMGALHQHAAGGAIMQHIWFTPSNLDLAFGDATVKQQAIQQAVAR
jgi:hypothetical protein